MDKNKFLEFVNEFEEIADFVTAPHEHSALKIDCWQWDELLEKYLGEEFFDVFRTSGNNQSN